MLILCCKEHTNIVQKLHDVDAACESPSELASLLHVQKPDVEHALWMAEHVEG